MGDFQNSTEKISHDLSKQKSPKQNHGNTFKKQRRFLIPNQRDKATKQRNIQASSCETTKNNYFSTSLRVKWAKNCWHRLNAFMVWLLKNLNHLIIPLSLLEYV